MTWQGKVVARMQASPGTLPTRKAAIKIAQELTPLLVAGGELDVEQVEAGQSIVIVHLWVDIWSLVLPLLE